jgi:GT2 family glycosyltransferase
MAFRTEVAGDRPVAVAGVSFVVCTRNRHAQLGQCLAALARLPDDPPWELILVDNGSSPPIADMPGLRGFAGRLTCLVEAQVGLGAARDTGWRHARHGLVTFTDDDCYVQPDFVAQLLAASRAYPAAGYFGGRITLFDPTDLPTTIDLRTAPVHYKQHSFIPPGSLQGANLSVRREVLQALGGIDRRLGQGTPFPCEDLDLVARASWAGWGGMYHPGPSVAHHHGRKDRAALADLHAHYDRGRGAYYMLFLARTRPRPAYLMNWLRAAGRDLRRGRFGKLAREVAAAWRFRRAHP